MEPIYGDIDETLILAYLSGEDVGPEKQEAIERWLQKEENQAEAKALFQAWELSALHAAKKVDVAKGLRSVKAKLGIEKAPSTVIFPTWVKLGIAASVIMAALVTVWFSTDKPTQPISLTTLEDKTNFTLPDSSTITLRKGAMLTYVGDDFLSSRKRREVTLTGEAYFDVQSDKEHPFTVRTHDAEVTVLGTAFFVKSATNEPTHVLVTEGKVQVAILATGKSYLLEADREITIDSAKTTEVKTLNLNKLYWQTDMLKFEDDSLHTVFETLGREFDLPVILSNEQLRSCKLTATFRKQSLETILEVIAKTHPLTIRNENGTLIIDGDGCK